MVKDKHGHESPAEPETGEADQEDEPCRKERKLLSHNVARQTQNHNVEEAAPVAALTTTSLLERSGPMHQNDASEPTFNNDRTRHRPSG